MLLLLQQHDIQRNINLLDIINQFKKDKSKLIFRLLKAWPYLTKIKIMMVKMIMTIIIVHIYARQIHNIHKDWYKQITRISNLHLSCRTMFKFNFNLIDNVLMDS